MVSSWQQKIKFGVFQQCQQVHMLLAHIVTLDTSVALSNCYKMQINASYAIKYRLTVQWGRAMPYNTAATIYYQ